MIPDLETLGNRSVHLSRVKFCCRKFNRNDSRKNR